MQRNSHDNPEKGEVKRKITVSGSEISRLYQPSDQNKGKFLIRQGRKMTSI
jgi:hypothetical protein